MQQFVHLTPPTEGAAITRRNGELVVPDDPIVPFIEGDGTGPDIWRASVRVFDAAVAKAYGGKKRIVWFEVPAGEKAKDAVRRVAARTTPSRPSSTYKVAIKGPLTTPVGGGIRSLNVTLRQVLDLYACVRPVRYFDGHAGAGQASRADERRHLPREHRGRLRRHRVGAAARRRPSASSSSSRRRWASASGPTPASASSRCPSSASKRLVRKAIQYAIANKRKTVTLVHKGNIMKFTEGAFRDWGYEVAKAEFRDQIVTEDEVTAGASQRGQGPHQRSHRRQRVPADPDPHRRLRRLRHAEPERRLPVGRLRGAGRRPRHGAGRQHRRRHRLLRGDARHGAEVRRQGRHQPRLGDPVGRDDARSTSAGTRRPT